MEKDLTRGNVPLGLIGFALPILLGNLLQACYSFADMAIVGRLIGSEGLSAVESASRMYFLVASLWNGIAVAGTVLAAKAKGAGDTEGLRGSVGTLFALAGISALAVTAACVAFGGPLVAAMDVPSEARQGAKVYLVVVSLGAAFSFGYGALCAVMRGLGDSTGPFVYGAVSVVANVALDLLFVGPLGMGAGGAALATVLSQGLSFATAAIRLARRGMIPGLRFSDLKPNLRECVTIAKIGLPAAAQMGMLNLSYVLATGMFNAHGLTVAAASGIGLKVNTAVAMPTWAIGQAVITMAGQCLGAGNPARAKKAALVGLAINLGMNAAMVVAIRLCAGGIVGLFTTDPAVVSEATRYLSICCSFNFLFYAAMVTFDSFATGTGNTLFAMVNSLIHSVALRLTLSAYLAWGLHWGASGLYWGEALSPIVPCLVAAIWFASGVWKRVNKEDIA